MEASCRTSRYCAFWLILVLSVLLTGCATSPTHSVRSSYQLSDLEGTWSWRQSWGSHNSCHGDFVLKKDGETYVGTLNDVFEGTYGDKIKDVALSGNRLATSMGYRLKSSTTMASPMGARPPVSKL